MKFVPTAALLALAAPAVAQTAPATPAAQAFMPTPEFIAAAQAYGQCLGRTAQAAPPTLTPEVAAHQAVAGCATERAAMDTRFEGWVSGPGFPQDKRDLARAQYKAQVGNVEPQVTAEIREMRTPATPAPVPPPGAAPAPKR